MITVFTLCSNNYLAQAKTLGDSVIATNPAYKFLIGLVDKISAEIDYSFFHPHEIVPIEQIKIEDFRAMFERYDIRELNTAVKPYLINYLFSRDLQIDSIIYLDPDILVYDAFTHLENNLQDHNVVITPHFFTPLYDDLRLDEADILNSGLYNLGFIAVKRSEETQRFLNWWMIKLKDKAHFDFANGMFFDQIWINLVPLYFEKIKITRHLGHNVAYWNLHERNITSKGEKYFVNDRFPLIFYHFSGYLFHVPEEISQFQTRYSFDQRQDIVPLFRDYHQRVMDNRFQQYSPLPCYYHELKKQFDKERVKPDKSVYKKMVSVGKRGIRKILGRG